MRQAVHIFLKDSRQFRWPIAVLLVWTAVFALSGEAHLSPSGGIGIYSTTSALTRLSLMASNYLFPAAWFFLISLVFHAEALPGDRQFWLTRPYSRASLLMAKALFILAYVVVPFAIAQAMILSRNDLSLTSTLPALLWNQVLLTAVIVLPAAALATVTSTLTQFIFSLALAPVVAVPVMVSFWSDFEWVRISLWTLLVTLVAGLVVTMQFHYRRTGRSRVIGLLGAAVTLTASLTLPWQAAFAVQAYATGSPERTMTATVWSAFEKRPNAVPSPTAGPTTRGIQLFYQVRGLPDGAKIACEASEVRVEVADGQGWESGLVLSPSATGYFDPPAVCPLQTTIPASFLDAAASQPVTIRATLYVTGLERGPSTPVVRAPALSRVGRLAACSTSEYRVPSLQATWAHVQCRGAFRPVYPVVASASTKSGVPTQFSVEYAPWPAWVSIVPLEAATSTLTGSPDEVTVAEWVPVAHERLTIETAGVHLPDYEWAR